MRIVECRSHRGRRLADCKQKCSTRDVRLKAFRGLPHHL
jgi:hypothetical protein